MFRFLPARIVLGGVSPLGLPLGNLVAPHRWIHLGGVPGQVMLLVAMVTGATPPPGVAMVHMCHSGKEKEVVQN